jgi:hypothetical protein
VTVAAGRIAATAALTVALSGAGAATAQTPSSRESVIEAIQDEATNDSRLEPLAQALLDSIGPRLTGSPGMERAQDWAVQTLESWGVDARTEEYGTWEGWDRGASHIDLVVPRVRALEGRVLAWSAGTGGAPLEAPVAIVPAIGSRAEWDAFAGTVGGKWVMVGLAQPSCRPDEQWAEFQQPGSGQRMADARQAEAQRLARSLRAGSSDGTLAAVHRALEDAGAAGIIVSDWPGFPGTVRVMEAYNRRTPTFELSCEDFGLVHRLAENGDGPVVRLTSDARGLGEVPVSNVVAEIPGTELPDEYVVLSAHFDSWDGASGGTDNGAGAVQMMETMRVLAAVAPRPKRTLLLTLWSGEEQGLLGSGAFAEDHPEILDGIQVVFNQDRGTGRIVHIDTQGFTDSGEPLTRWLAQVPGEVTSYVETDMPGRPSGGSDYGSFVCRGVPSIPLGLLGWKYGEYTWHSNRDTYDKLVFDDLRDNVVLTASLAYLASEDPERVGRGRRELAAGPDGQPASWPECRPVLRRSPEWG